MRRSLVTVLIVLSAQLFLIGLQKEVNAETIIQSYSSEPSSYYQDQSSENAKSSIGNFSVLCEVNDTQRALSKAILLDVRSKSAKDFDLVEPEETENTFEGNALIKAKAAIEVTGLPALSDDSGLAIDALNGAPGVYSADWAETESGRDFTMAMNRVNEKIGGIDGTQAAKFVSVLALALPDGQEHFFKGVVEGILSWPPRGDKGFGYDPIFVPDGFDQTFAEMEAMQKNNISHRGRAIQKFEEFLKING